MFQQIEPNQSSTPETIPRFFRDRAIGWCILAAALLGVSAVFTWATNTGSTFILPAGVAAILCLFQGVRLLYIAKKKGYFVLRLRCTEIRSLNFFENLPKLIAGPASNSTSHGSKQVTFETETDQKVFFVYEQSRKFIQGAKYDFYFYTPQNGEAITADMLENLKIDHSIVSEEIRHEDIRL